MQENVEPRENKLHAPDTPQVLAEEPDDQGVAHQEGVVQPQAVDVAGAPVTGDTSAETANVWSNLFAGAPVARKPSVEAADIWSRPQAGTLSAGHEPDVSNAHGTTSCLTASLGYKPPFGRLQASKPDISRQRHPLESPSKPRFPPSFPAHHYTQNMNEIAAYLANASYVAALGGTPLADIKYGIIIVPVGEESLLFSRLPDPDLDVSDEMLDAVDDDRRAFFKAQRMHNSEKDSTEFRRHRFNDNFPAVSVADC